MIEAFFSGLVQVFTWPTLPLMLMGIAVGFVVGILPGLGGVVALALMLPFTFDMDPISAFAFLLGMMAIAGTTGDITSILFGVPGESISAAMVIDGHPMAKNGEAGRALGAALMSSLIGAVVGAFLLAAAIPIVRPLVLNFRSPEFFALAVLGVMFIAAVSGRNMLKGLISGAIGLALATVGLNQLTGIERYTFGRLELWEGISLVAVTTGIFGLPEIIDLWKRGTGIAHVSVTRVGGVREGVLDAFRHWRLTIRSSAIGTFAGIIPGLGAAIGQWIAYAHAVHSSRDPGKFGKGDVRGVLGPGAANNSSLGGGLIPTIAFGVPGNVAFAILLGAFLIQGLVPGPAMLTDHLDVTFSFTWIIVTTNVIAVAICFAFINQLVKITELRGSLVIPPVVILIFLGGYVDASSWFVMFITLGAGGLGYFMERFGWPRPPLILGLVLGSLIERNLFTSYQAYGIEFLWRPLVIIILLVGVSAAAWSLLRARRMRGEPGESDETFPAIDLLSTVPIVFLVGFMIWQARAWPHDAKLFPLAIGTSIAILVAVFIAVTAYRARTSGRPAMTGGRSLIRSLDGGTQRELSMALWCVAFAVVISLLGFKIGGAISAALFLSTIARERWKVSLGFAAGIYVFFVVTTDILQLASLDPGLVSSTLGVGALDGFLIEPLLRALSSR